MGQRDLNDGYDGHLEGSSRKRRYTSGNLHGMNLIDGELSSSDSEDEFEGWDSGIELQMTDTGQGVSFNLSSDEDSDFSTDSFIDEVVVQVKDHVDQVIAVLMNQEFVNLLPTMKPNFKRPSMSVKAEYVRGFKK